MGVADAGAPDADGAPDAGDAGLQPGTLEWCQWVSAESCYYEDCQRGPPQWVTNGFCDCGPDDTPGWASDCLGEVNGPCRPESPECEPGAQCECEGEGVHCRCQEG